MRIRAGYPSAIHPQPWLRWAVIVVCLPPLVLIPAPGLRFSWSAAGEPRCCTARPGSICRCPQWRRDAGVCCCSRGAGARLVTSDESREAATTATCCSIRTGQKVSAPATCCSQPTRTQAMACGQAGGPSQPKRSALSASWQACPCGDESNGGDLSLVAKPRVVPGRLSYRPEVTAVIFAGWPSRHLSTRTDSPEDPPPRIDVAPV